MDVVEIKVKLGWNCPDDVAYVVCSYTLISTSFIVSSDSRSPRGAEEVPRGNKTWKYSHQRAHQATMSTVVTSETRMVIWQTLQAYWFMEIKLCSLIILRQGIIFCVHIRYIYIYMSLILIGLMETTLGIIFEAVVWDKLNTIAEASPWIHLIFNYLTCSIFFRQCLLNKQCDINPKMSMVRSFTHNRVPVFIRVWQVVRSTYIMCHRERQSSTSVLTTWPIRTHVKMRV